MRKSKFMKALLVFGMSAITATSIVGMAACTDNGGDEKKPDGNDGVDTCQHQFDGLYNNYMANSSDHWHYCIVCEKELDRAAHVDGNSDGKCDTCGYEVAHSFDTSKWEKDASGHWYAPTCSHTTEKGQFAAHVDEDATPNTCDVCGFVGSTSDGYKAFVQDHVTAEATKIIDSTFFVGKTLPLKEANWHWGTAGLYASANSETHKVDVSGGKASLVTPKGEPATILYLDWGNVAGTVVEGFFKISNVVGTEGKYNGYTAVQFTTSDGTNDSEIFGLRTNKGGSMGYRLNGGSEVIVSGAQAWSSGAGDDGSIEVYYKYDTATNKITVTIGGNEFVTDLQLTGNTIKGIKFSSGSGNADAYAVDDIIVVTNPANLTEYKKTVKANADAAVEKITTAGFDVSTATSEAAQTFTAAVDGAETADACTTAYNTYYAALLTAYGDAVKNKINADYPSTSYDDEKNEDAAAYTAAVAKLGTDVEAANTIEKVTAAYNTAKTTISALGDDDFWGLEDVVITIGNGTSGNNTVTVKQGVQITKADLDAHVTVESGKKVVGYYTDSTYATEVTVPFNATASTTIYAKIGATTTTTVGTFDGTPYKSTSSATFACDTATDLPSTTGSGLKVIKGTGGSDVKLGKQNNIGTLQFGGGVGVDKNAVIAECGAGTVTVTISYFQGKADRYIDVLDSTGKIVADSADKPTTEDKAEKTATMTFTLDKAGTIYIGSHSSGIYISSITVTVNG